MRSAVRLVLLATLAGLAPLPVRAGESWYLELEEGRAAAQAQGKDLLIDFGGSDWCAPCKWLKERVLSKADFIGRASGAFVLVDIDLLVRNTIPADRKARYEKLQDQYGIESFPTVVLATADGRAYARTTYREAFQTPETFWNYLAPFRERGVRLRAAMTRAEALQGQARWPSWSMRSRRSTRGSLIGSTPIAWPSCARPIRRTRPAISPSSTAAGRSTRSWPRWICTRRRSTRRRLTR